MCSLKSAGPIIGPASISSTEMPRSASTFVTVPPPAPDPITTTSWRRARWLDLHHEARPLSVGDYVSRPARGMEPGLDVQARFSPVCDK